MRRHCKALLVLAAAAAITFAGCGQLPPEPQDSLDAQHGIADQSLLYGMDYLMEERSDASLDIEKEVTLMKNMGVKTVRQWMHFTHFMTSPTEVRTGSTTLANMHKLLKACEDAGMTNVGMCHHNFWPGKSDTTAKPFLRDVSEGSDYVKWLDDYYTSWKTLVTEFPEVLYWEIDNEPNNGDFMHNGTHNSYNVRQMAQITADMFYYASRAIHEANPNAKTVMGGLTEPEGLGRGNTAVFLQTLYDNIASGNYGYFYGKEEKSAASTDPDDYFEIACWHPYMSNFNKQNFIDINNEYYNIILQNEKKHKKVFFTEIGWNDGTIGGEQNAIRFMEEMFDAVKQMPYVETVQLFKLYDNGTQNNWDGEGFLYYGLVQDPDPAHRYTPYERSTDRINIGTDGYCINGAPKNKAYAYQRLAGGEGSLDVLWKEEA